MHIFERESGTHHIFLHSKKNLAKSVISIRHRLLKIQLFCY